MVRVFAVARGRISGGCVVSAIVAVAAGAVAGFEATPAAARGYPSVDAEQFRTLRKPYGRGGPRAIGAPSAREAKRAEPKSPERPLFVVISIGDQRVSIYNHHGLVERSAISTGVPGHPTPKGVFTIIGRERFHRSNLYSGAPMPFMQRITWSGIAMHLGVVPGHPASHGCIRLPAAFAARLWGLTRIGERVVITPRDVAPVEFAHPLLPTPKMQTFAEAEKVASAADSPPAEPPAAQTPSQLDPRRYAERLKAKAVAEAAAAAAALKEAAATIAASQPAAARAAAAAEAAAAAGSLARAKADAAARAYEAAEDAAVARQNEAVAVAELRRSEDDRRAEAGPLTKAYVDAVAAKEAAAAAKASAEAALAEAAAKLDTAKADAAARTAELTDARRRADGAKAASDAAAKAEKEATLRLAPVSVLVSKKDKRIYVRQGLTPLFDAPAGVRDPETPLGSHLYIATATEGDGAALKWTVLSMPARLAEEQGERKTRMASIDDRAGTSAKHGPASSPAEALERVEIAPDVRDRIAERLWTGGSLIISDQPVSGETGAVGTDLTVKLH